MCHEPGDEKKCHEPADEKRENYMFVLFHNKFQYHNCTMYILNKCLIWFCLLYAH